jgi:hypothetical protein
MKLLIYTILLFFLWSCKEQVVESNIEDVYHISYGTSNKVMSITSYNKHLNTNDQYIDEEIDYLFDDTILTVKYSYSMSITPDSKTYQFIVDSNNLIKEDIEHQHKVYYQEGKCIRIDGYWTFDTLYDYWEILWNNNNITEISHYSYNSTLNKYTILYRNIYEYYDTKNLSTHFFPYLIDLTFPYNNCISPEYLGMVSKSLPSKVTEDYYTRKFEYELYDDGKIKKITIDETNDEIDYWERKYVSFIYE